MHDAASVFQTMILSMCVLALESLQLHGFFLNEHVIAEIKVPVLKSAREFKKGNAWIIDHDVLATTRVNVTDILTK